MRKILLATLTTAALLGWNGTAIANPPAAPSTHGEEHHEGKDDHKADKHHGDKHEAEKPKA